MKNLTYQELLKAPTEIQHIYIAALNDRPVAHSFAVNAMQKYPEYFQDEIERAMKWQKVTDEDRKGYNDAIDEIHKELLPGYGKGFIYNAANWEVLSREYELVKDEIDRRRKQAFNAWYGKYGLVEE